MKLSFDLKNLPLKERLNIGIILAAALLVLVLAAGFMIKRSVGIVVNAKSEIDIPRGQTVRVNFDLYNTIAGRRENQRSFELTPVVYSNPFGVRVEE